MCRLNFDDSYIFSLLKPLLAEKAGFDLPLGILLV